jgi:hypothetical protein
LQSAPVPPAEAASSQPGEPADKLTQIVTYVSADPHPDVIEGIIEEARLKRQARHEHDKEVQKRVAFQRALDEQRALNAKLSVRDREEETLYMQVVLDRIKEENIRDEQAKQRIRDSSAKEQAERLR